VKSEAGNLVVLCPAAHGLYHQPILSLELQGLAEHPEARFLVDYSLSRMIDVW
jgi:hypothetical protein